MQTARVWVVCLLQKITTKPTIKLRKFEPTHTYKTDADGKNIMANAKWVAVEIEQDIKKP